MEEKENLTRLHAFIFASPPNPIAQQLTLKYSLVPVESLAYLPTGVERFSF